MDWFQVPTGDSAKGQSAKSPSQEKAKASERLAKWALDDRCLMPKGFLRRMILFHDVSTLERQTAVATAIGAATALFSNPDFAGSQVGVLPHKGKDINLVVYVAGKKLPFGTATEKSYLNKVAFVVKGEHGMCAGLACPRTGAIYMLPAERYARAFGL